MFVPTVLRWNVKCQRYYQFQNKQLNLLKDPELNKICYTERHVERKIEG